MAPGTDPAGPPEAPGGKSPGEAEPEDSREDDRDGHRRRLREKFLKAGLNAFLDHEIVEILLTLGTPRRDCRGAARRALREFHTLRGVLEAEAHDLQKIDGIGAHNVFGIRLVQEVSRRFLKDRMLSRPFCRSSGEAFDYLYHAMRDLKRECFKVLFLDSKNQIIEERTLFEGTVDSSAVYPREIMKLALRFNAAGMVFVHNHPSGDPDPSSCDREITRELVFAARIMQLKVLDHLVIGNNRYFSFADHGLIQDYDLLYLSLNR
ncbi:MAG: DNA repair protein RadC [Acidobacteriota bacterium]|nr:DNA repair protein RadC [Acidobacteriota bacterium]